MGFESPVGVAWLPDPFPDSGTSNEPDASLAAALCSGPPPPTAAWRVSMVLPAALAWRPKAHKLETERAP